ncbi:MAG: 4-hydroxy-tetrahydrodipicolinate reductase [Deltaproteobacteria bacterium]|nr:4-hydroxy-tetrahydrodipicolinate reductase [Deltaproteobacteria bacterium]MCX7952490.1 4-hydroxy-tetrahydrodipicolinate reductase [Deltaproteobacteria bacterium]
MKSVLVGVGKMGVEIKRLLAKRGHSIIAEFSKKTISDFPPNVDFDIIFDFTTAEAFLENFKLYAFVGKPVVVGTTGWLSHLNEVIELFSQKGVSLMHGSNFSLGVNLFFKVLEKTGQLISQTRFYDTAIIEIHHNQKKDAPSGTAIKLSDILLKMGLHPTISSSRVGHIFGDHIVLFDSMTDSIELKHHAKNREGFALGAVMAGEYLLNNPGIFEYSEIFDRIVEWHSNGTSGV